jgi:hypothetical protein
MGDDLPKVTPKPKPRKVVSLFWLEPETDYESDHIPVGPIIQSAVLLTQGNFFGELADLITDQPTLPISAPDKKKSGKLPIFKSKFYKTEDCLQAKPKDTDAEAKSLWPGRSEDRSKPVSTAPKVLANIGAAAERSMMAINYFEFFAVVQRRAHVVQKDTRSTKEEVAAALDLSIRIAASMGRCLEDVTRQHAFILASATVARREAVLLHHKTLLQNEASDWPRAEPLLTGTSLFSTVTSKTKPLLQEH